MHLRNLILQIIINHAMSSQRSLALKDLADNDNGIVLPTPIGMVLYLEVGDRNGFANCTSFTFPSIDNHAHPLLKAENRSAIPFEGLISEAGGNALSQDAVHTLACFRATAQLSRLFGLTKNNPTWDDVKAARDELDYDELCMLCFTPTGIQCILIDDGLGGVDHLAENYTWHDRFTRSATKRIVRIEPLAQVCTQHSHFTSST